MAALVAPVERPAAQPDTPAAVPSAAAVALPFKPSELRGVWMGYHGEPTWDRTMATLRDHRCNAVFPWMASPGGAFYRSRVLPVAPAVEQDGDYLSAAAAWGRTHGIEVHARFLALFLYLGPAGVKDRYAAENRLMVDANGKPVRDWLCPAKPANRHLIIDAACELAAGYDIDGLQFDYLRYPWSTACYCGSCRYLFQQVVGEKIGDWPAAARTGRYAGRFGEWRRQQVTSLLAAIREHVLAVKPDLCVSAAVFVDWEKHRHSFGQDWRLWVERGLVDFVCPMDYTADDATFAGWVSKQVGWVGSRVPLYVGLGPLADNVRLSPEQVVEQVRLSRELGGDGFVLFKYTEALARDYLPLLRPEPDLGPIPPPHRGPRVDFVISPAHEQKSRPGYLEGERISATAVLGPPGGRVRGWLSLFAAAGGLLEDIQAIDGAGTREVRCTLRLPAGRYRLAVRGNVHAARRDEPFASWSPVLEVWPRENATATPTGVPSTGTQ